MDDNFRPGNGGSPFGPQDSNSPFGPQDSNSPFGPYQSNNSPYGAPGGSPYGTPNNSPYGAPGGSPYGTPNNSPYGAPNTPPPYNTEQQPPAGAPNGVDSLLRAAPPTFKGKPFAIVAFVLGIVAFVFLMSALVEWFEIASAQAYVENASSSYMEYYIINEEELLMTMQACFILSIIAAVASDVFVVFAYLGHSANVKNGTPAKFILVFAIIATAVANISLITSLALMF